MKKKNEFFERLLTIIPKGRDVALLKTLTGRDVVTARYLYENEFQFIPVFKLIINSNVKPMVNDMTLFTSGRIKVIEFNRHFSEEEQDVYLKDRLESQENLSGLLNWCLEGLRKYREQGTTVPMSVRKATEQYKLESDKMQNFVNECIVQIDGRNLPVREAYRNNWSESIVRKNRSTVRCKIC